MMKKIRNEKGITMIALIITIIVILILAGITLLMIVGDNGIITRAKEARKETLLAAATEKVQMATATAQMVIEEENATNGAYDPVTAYSNTSSSIYKAINDELSGSDWEVTNSGGKVIISYKNSDYLKANNNEAKKYWINLNSVGANMVDVKEGLTSKITASDYGDYINYDVDIDGNTSDNDWRIFYNDGENIYLIADDYISKDIAPAGKGGTALTQNSDYSLSMNNVINDYAGASDINSKFTKWLKYLNSYPNSTNNNMKAVAYMLDDSPSVWGKFSNSKAEWSIGAPTLDLFLASWNDTWGLDVIEFQVSNDSSDMYNGFSEGYKIKQSWETSWDYTMSHALERDTTNLYWIQGTPFDDTLWGYIASPSAEKHLDLFCTSYMGDVQNAKYDSGSAGFRPIVCLKSGIKATENNNVWTIE